MDEIQSPDMLSPRQSQTDQLRFDSNFLDK